VLQNEGERWTEIGVGGVILPEPERRRVDLGGGRRDLGFRATTPLRLRLLLAAATRERRDERK